MLFDRNIPGFSLFLPIIIAIALVTVGFLVFVVQMAVRAHRKPIVSGKEELIGFEGKVIIREGEAGLPKLRVHGELWQVKSDSPLKNGDQVRVIGMEELILIVTPIASVNNKEGTER